MNNKTLINTFNSDNNSIAKIKTQHRQIVKPMTTNCTFFTVFVFSKISKIF